MKSMLTILALVLSFNLFADEIPVPSKVYTFNNPTLNGLPFAAIFAHDYATNAEVGGVDIAGMATNSARFICLFMGYDRVYSYALTPVTTEKTKVLFVDTNLVANPVDTIWIDGDTKGQFATTVFGQLQCFRNRPY
ncbi:MAG: hypothetical protein H7177_08090 [Rhizobacter sp.]|nr:hypothetical protein [Bacteriovorax sp.]